MERLGRNRPICRWFLNDRCTYGDRCRFRHERPTQICRHFQKGGCWFGENCKFLHILPPSGRPSVPSASSTSTTPEVVQQQSRNQNSSLNMETSERHSQAETQLTTSVSGLEIGHLQANSRNGEIEGAAAAPQCDDLTEAILRSKDMTCGICMETIFEKHELGKCKFGILPNCKHAFCLSCIRVWRKTRDMPPGVVKSCPVCRVNSGFFVPHEYWVEGQEKVESIEAFKKKFSGKTCGYYLRHGHCPFKSDCLYQHDKTFRRPPREIPEETLSLSSDVLNFLIAMSLSDSEDEDEYDNDEEEFSLFNLLSSLPIFD